MLNIQTVRGHISPDEAGKTLCHEHLSLEFEVAQSPNPDPLLRPRKDEVLSLENLWWINQNPYSNTNNLRMCEERPAIKEEMDYFKENGGNTIVENTTYGIQRDIKYLQCLSKHTGVNIVAGTGYYVDLSRKDSLNLTVEEMYTHMENELTKGCDNTDIKCGVIGEVGCTWPLTKSEKCSLRATGMLQDALKCPVIIHPGRHPDAPSEILQIYQEAGGDVKKLIMSHLDRTLIKNEDILSFAKEGCILEYDLFGIEISHYQLCDTVDMPSDAQRIQRINMLIENGYKDSITIAHDIHTKHRLMKYGGHGFSHILRNIVPKMIARGISEENALKMITTTPQRWLSWDCSAYK